MSRGDILVHKPSGEVYTYEYDFGFMICIKNIKTGAIIHVPADFLPYYEIKDAMH